MFLKDGEVEKAKYREWTVAQDNPVAAATPGGEICWMWQRKGTCSLGDDCKQSSTHTPGDAPKDKDGNPMGIKGNVKGRTKAIKARQGKRQRQER